MEICLLDNTSFKYNSRDKYSPILRGGETVIINLSQSLSGFGHNITIFNNCYNNEVIDNVKWRNINNLEDNNTNRVFLNKSGKPLTYLGLIKVLKNYIGIKIMIIERIILIY